MLWCIACTSMLDDRSASSDTIDRENDQVKRSRRLADSLEPNGEGSRRMEEAAVTVPLTYRLAKEFAVLPYGLTVSRPKRGREKGDGNSSASHASSPPSPDFVSFSGAKAVVTGLS
ncbi:hypothetical protein KM043_016737 [Ampulex compressa]|nr:hypothetical protein KM043_016737 [Ampulex compressa]